MPAEKPKAKSSKPLMEKRRRARINDSLMQLKTLVLDALNKNNSRHSKLEKADILEMTVRYLRTIQRQQISASVNADPATLGQYRSGYAQCINEVTRYLGTNGNTTDNAPELRTRLVGHLANLCTSGQQQAPRAPTPSVSQQQQSPVTFQIQHHQQAQQQVQTRLNAPVEGAVVMPSMQVITHVQQPPTSIPVQRLSPKPEGARTEYALTTPAYNTAPRGQLMSPTVVRAQSPMNSAQVIQGVPMGVTGALPTGDITLVFPQQALPNGQVPTHLIPVYAPSGSAVPTSATNATNIQSAIPNACHVSLSSPRAAATVPSTSPTSPQSSMTIPAQHALVTQPSAVAPTQVAYCVPVQTKLSPVVREYSHHQRIEPAREPAVGQCDAKNDPMWRPW